jgi:hypothetical protein
MRTLVPDSARDSVILAWGEFFLEHCFSEDRFLNDFFLYVLEDLHTGQGNGNLRFTSDDCA